MQVSERQTPACKEEPERSLPAGTAKTISPRVPISWTKEAAAVALVLGVIIAWCWPAFVHGWVYGSFDEALSMGLGNVASSAVHNHLSGDQALQDAAWLRLDYLAIHAGHLPLWNPYNALGSPEMANFQSGAFALSSLLAYLVPLPVSYTVEVLAKLAIAGTGTYFAARSLGVSIGGSVFAGIVAELSGAFSGWAGWPQDSVAAWMGWIIGAVAWILLKPPRRWPVVALAVAVAFSILGGFPELIGLEAIALGVFVVIAMVVAPQAAKPAVLGRLALGLGSGIAASAAVWLPSSIVLERSMAWGRLEGAHVEPGLLVGLFTNTYFGSPISKAGWFGPLNYYEAAAYLGPPVVMLAGAALAQGPRGRLAWPLFGSALVSLDLALRLGPLAHWVQLLPSLSGLDMTRALLPLSFVLAILSGMGLDGLLARNPGWLGAAPSLTALGTALGIGALLIWLYLTKLSGLGTLQAQARASSLWWPAALDGASVLTAASAALAWRPRRIFAFGLGLAETAFLVVAGAPLNTWGHSYYPTDNSIKELSTIVGSSLVGFGGPHPLWQFSTAGIHPDANSAYGIEEFALYDAATPKSLVAAYQRYSGAPPSETATKAGVSNFDPTISNLAQAKAFGVSYVLFPPHIAPAANSGLHYVTTIDGERLYKAPGAKRASFGRGPDRVVSALRFSDNHTAILSVAATRGQWLHLAVTNEPSWHASADGKPTAVRPWHQGMLEAWVPAGTHELAITYSPAELQSGEKICLAGLLTLVIWCAGPSLIAAWHTKRRPRIA